MSGGAREREIVAWVAARMRAGRAATERGGGELVVVGRVVPEAAEATFERVCGRLPPRSEAEAFEWRYEHARGGEEGTYRTVARVGPVRIHS